MVHDTLSNTLFIGYDCEEVKIGCRQNPCLVGQECFNLNVSEQLRRGQSHRCGPCPTGYTEHGTACEGW